MCTTQPESVDVLPAKEELPSSLSLNDGIYQIAASLENELPEGIRIAVVNMKSPSASFTDYVLEELQGALQNGKKLRIFERRQLEQARKEIQFGMSGDVDDETAAKLGHFLGVQMIITGAFTDLGEQCRLHFKVLNVESAEWRAASAVTVRHDSTVSFLIPNIQVPSPERIPPKPDPQLAVLFFNSGFKLYEAKKYKDAVVDFTKALEVDPNRVSAWYYRGLSYFYRSDGSRARADFGEVLNIDQNHDSARGLYELLEHLGY
jgi:tetratricopeptide (TPR) repeat protein